MTIPPNMARCLSIWFIVWISSRVDKRAPFILGSAVVAIIGVTLQMPSLSILTGIRLHYSSHGKDRYDDAQFRIFGIYSTTWAGGGQYVGVHFAAMGIYMGNSLLLRFMTATASLYLSNLMM